MVRMHGNISNNLPTTASLARIILRGIFANKCCVHELDCTARHHLCYYTGLGSVAEALCMYWRRCLGDDPNSWAPGRHVDGGTASVLPTKWYGRIVSSVVHSNPTLSFPSVMCIVKSTSTTGIRQGERVSSKYGISIACHVYSWLPMVSAYFSPVKLSTKRRYFDVIR